VIRGFPKGARVVGRTARVKHNARFEDLLAFQIKSLGLPAPERQYRFAKGMKRQFESDFAWPELKLLVEVEGGIWKRGGGAHSHPLDVERDIERRQYAVLLGFFVLPVITDEVTSGKAIAVIQQALAVRGWQRGLS
jgi:very-short-patch-repair endonuclease